MRLWRDGGHCRQRSRSAMNSIRRGPQQPETVARSKNFAGRQNYVRAGSTGSSMGWAPEASCQADDIRPQEPYAPASARSLARTKKLQPAPTTETRPAVLSYALPSSTIICASRRAKAWREAPGKMTHRLKQARAGMAELADALDLGSNA